MMKQNLSIFNIINFFLQFKWLETTKDYSIQITSKFISFIYFRLLISILFLLTVTKGFQSVQFNGIYPIFHGLRWNNYSPRLSVKILCPLCLNNHVRHCQLMNSFIIHWYMSKKYRYMINVHEIISKFNISSKAFKVNN